MKYIMLIIIMAGLCAANYIVERSSGFATPYLESQATWIGLENGFSFDTRNGEPNLPAGLMIESYARGTPGPYLIQCIGPVYPEWTARLRAMGVTIYAYWPYYALLAAMDDAQAAAVKSLPFVRWVGIYQPAYKVNIELLDAAGLGLIDIQLFPDANLKNAMEKISAVGARVIDYSESESGKLVYAECDLSRIADLARIPDVLALIPFYPDLILNQNSQWVCQTGWQSSVPVDSVGRRVWGKGIRGQNLKLGYSDTGITTGHDAYRDNAIPIADTGHFANHRKIVAYLLLTGAAFGDVGTTYHGSHVGGTIAGDDSVNGGTNANDGLAYKARLFFVDIANASGGLVTGTDLAPLYDIFYNEAVVGPIRQHSASWGRAGTGYIDRDAFSDAWLWKHKDFCDIFAAGNAGPTYRSTQHPANAKNVIAVGALQNGTLSNQIASFSSRGPTVDLRIKPTVCTPGQAIVSVDGATTSGYKSLDGTSMATPACNASAGLIRQYLKQGFYPSGVATPADSFRYISAVLIRAMLIVSADPNVGSYVVPDSNIGFGRVDLDSVLYFSGDMRRLALWDDTMGVATGAYKEFQIQVNDTTLPLRAALVWWDTAAAIGANPALVNNLDFQITNAQGTFYRGNQMAGGVSTPNPGTYDSRNVEEVIRVNVPRSGIWTIRVTGASVAYPRANFAIAATGGLSPIIGVDDAAAPQSRAGIVRLNALPNPFVNRMRIDYQLPGRTKVTLKLFDACGRLVATLLEETKASGQYSLEWRPDPNLGAGVYFLRLDAGAWRETIPITRTR
jgi:hypothetical protein